uniref:SFRICE_008728 n=1 Tax=Spodoptera frugiperda TaxID=7108 RepID=A0A2H1V5J1_SPOFR
MIRANIRATKWNVIKSASDLVIIPKKRKQKSLPAIKLNQEKRNKKHIKNENTTTTQHGVGVNKIYDIQKDAKGKSSLVKKDKKSKKGGKKHISKPSSTYTEEHLKTTAKRNQDKPKKPISKQRNSEVNQNKVQSKSVEAPIKRRNRYFNENKNYLKLVKPSNYKHVDPKVETKSYILSIMKKCNNDNKDLKKKSLPRTTQTSAESLSSNKSTKSKGTKTIKHRLRKQIWHWTKNSMKRSEHWSKFLADNNISLENLDIDKLDFSLLDVDALGIENKLLKRTILWLSK